jgi:glycosyltransferase involved in cell wall biosynthesis
VEPLRVLFAVGSLELGGAERRLVELLNRLDRRRFAPALSLMEERGGLLSRVPREIPIAAFHSAGHKPALPWRALGFFAPEMARTLHLRSVARRFQTQVIVGWMLQSAYEALDAARVLNVPLVASTVVTPDADLRTAFPGRSDARSRAERTMRQAAAVVTNSRDLASQVREFYRLPDDHVTAIPNLRDFDELDRQARETLVPRSTTAPRIVSIGRLQPQKGFLVLIAALKELHRATAQRPEVWIVGEGAQRAELQRAIQDAGLTASVRLLGSLANPFPTLLSADLFVLPSLFEGMPNVLIEALALGVPVVATDCPTGPRELLEGGRWGRLVPMNDPFALAREIAATLSDLPAARSQAAAAAPVIRERHDIRTGITRWEELLLRVASSRRGGSLGNTEAMR